MKKEAFLFLIVISLMIHLVSASYICSDQTQVKEDMREIKFGGTKAINGLLLGLVYTGESAAVHRMGVELFIDARLATLTNETPSIVINFTDDKSNSFLLVNSTESEANIKIDGTNKFIEKGDIIAVGSLEVFLFSLQGVYPGETNVVIMAGIDKISLSTYESLTKIVTVYGKEYLVELSSASDKDAIITVKKCNNESAKLVKIIDPSLNETEEINITNSTLNETNQTNNNYTTNQTIDSSFNQTNNTGNNSDVSQNEQENNEGDLMRYIALGGSIILGIIGLVLIVKYIKNRSIKETTEES